MLCEHSTNRASGRRLEFELKFVVVNAEPAYLCT